MSHIPSSAMPHPTAEPDEVLTDDEATPGEAPRPEPTAEQPPSQPVPEPVPAPVAETPDPAPRDRTGAFAAGALIGLGLVAAAVLPLLLGGSTPEKKGRKKKRKEA
jgi:hypothetical protein